MQVLSSLGVVFSIPYPAFYDRLVAYINVFSLDIFAVMPLGCTIDLNHDDYLLLRTLIPVGLLIISFGYRRHVMRASARKRRKGKHKEAKAAELLTDQILTYNFILVYLLYPSTSASIFATFQCETLDDLAQSRFLRIDFSVNCDSPYHRMMWYYAALMVIVYPLGVPALYAYLLFYRHGTELQLLRSLELKRAAIETHDECTTGLSSARKEADSTIKSVRKAWALVGYFSRKGVREKHGSGRLSKGSGSISMLDSEARFALAKEVESLAAEEEKRRTALPDYVQKLILGYELRTYYFEVRVQLVP